MLMKKVIFWTFMSLISVHIHGQILIHSFDSSKIIEVVLEIVEQCNTIYANSLMLAGAFDSHDIQRFANIRPVICFDEHSDHSLIEKRSNQVNIDHIKTTLISTDSTSGLQKMLHQIKKSKWWNSFGHFIILDKSNGPQHCDQASEFLDIAWRMDLINTVFICVNSEDKVIIYNYNPYNNWTMNGWTLDNVITKSDNNNWFLYERDSASANFSNCDEVFFDKTLHLGNYTGIRAATALPNENKCDIYRDYNKSIAKKFDVSMAKMLFDKLGVPFNYSCSFEHSGLNSKGLHYGIVKDLADNKYDIMLNYRFSLYSNSTEASAIVCESGFTFVGNDRGFISIFEAMIRFFRPWFLIATAVVMLIAIITLRVTIEPTISSATLQVISLLLGDSLSEVPTRSPPRIILATIFFFVLIFQTIFNSNILKFIMEPTTNNLQTFSELEEKSDFDLYCVRGFQMTLSPEVSKRCTIINNTCTILSNTTNSVCVYEQYLNLGFAKQFNLYTSQDVVNKRYLIYRMRKNWPLSRRVNSIYTRLFESGIPKYNLERAVRKISKTVHVNKEHRALEIAEMLFVFDMLMIGSAIGFLVLFLETIVKAIRNRRRRQYVVEPQQLPMPAIEG
ncbi:GSCOCG00002269001-RA-CDS [Cotesia congregata]|uniref:Uncharacterized protein n=1 Tax=Cotesia congregata TaxID=51543 RepID=A0A8J2HNL0_COTCN|nr:GSCOCG00002269001-RA-CDS [Cotesia congregata]CAG5103823.1 Protein of unknown function [Cotesia congregata]